MKTSMGRRYKNGRAKEYKTINQLKKEGNDIVFRSAGSHSPIDVIAINKLTKRITFIQCKPKSMSANKKKSLENDHDWLNDEFMAEFKVK
jgi:Holliday junction resolvase